MSFNNWHVSSFMGENHLSDFYRFDIMISISLTGIVASLAKPLADAQISIFYIDTYETSYLLVEDKNLAKAKEILGKFCEIKE